MVCDGCIVGQFRGEDIELRCNECSAVLGVIRTEIRRALLGLDSVCEVCPYCGRENVFPGFDEMKIYICQGCERAVKVE